MDFQVRLEPDFRLTQLVLVVSDKPEDTGAVWYMEDDTIETNEVSVVVKIGSQMVSEPFLMVIGKQK